MEIKEDLDSAINLSMEVRTVSDKEKRPWNATLRDVQLTVSGRAGGPGVSAPSPVLEWMGSWGRNLEGASALRLNTGERFVIQLGLKRSSPVQEKGAAPLPVP